MAPRIVARAPTKQNRTEKRYNFKLCWNSLVHHCILDLSDFLPLT